MLRKTPKGVNWGLWDVGRGLTKVTLGIKEAIERLMVAIFGLREATQGLKKITLGSERYAGVLGRTQ